ncbi:MAG: hypothetical protein K2F99_05115, partial [Muribaculaceae bacterium]|nr:hypothetical protein [Muribaculaceae bacterium]
MEQWAPGNPLWIAGSSGDGKSTLSSKLAKEHHATVITTDILLMRLGKSEEEFAAAQKSGKLDSVATQSINWGGNPAWDYVKEHPELPYGLRDPKTKMLIRSIVIPETVRFHNWLIEALKTDPRYKDNLYIIDSCNICEMDPDVMATKPLIIVGGSRLRSYWRRVKRDYAEKGGERPLVHSMFKYLKQYNSKYRLLDDNKDNFRAAITQRLHEAATVGNPIGYNGEDVEFMPDDAICFNCDQIGPGSPVWITGITRKLINDLAYRRYNFYESDDIKVITSDILVRWMVGPTMANYIQLRYDKKYTYDWGYNVTHDITQEYINTHYSV